MSDTVTLTDFLRARIDEDETGAGAASQDGRRIWRTGGWSYGPLGDADHETWDDEHSAAVTAFIAEPDNRAEIVVYDEGRPDIAQADHIARHDPARVLADCDAKRRIVALGICLACDVEQQPCDHRIETLRLLAMPYGDHPDYHDEWRP